MPGSIFIIFTHAANGPPRFIAKKEGQRYPVIGYVSLNVTTIGITDLDVNISWGEEVALIGRQGNDAITFEELADKFDSVHTEIDFMACHMNERSYRG